MLQFLTLKAQQNSPDALELGPVEPPAIPERPFALLRRVSQADEALSQAPRHLLLRSDPGQEDAPSWMPAQRTAFETLADTLAGKCLASDTLPGLWPHAEDAVSDAPSLLSFLRARDGKGWRFILDPAALLTPPMLTDAELHFERIFSTLGQHPALLAVVLATPEPGLLHRRGPLREGTDLTRQLLKQWRRWISPSIPICLVAEQLPSQIALVAAG